MRGLPNCRTKADGSLTRNAYSDRIVSVLVGSVVICVVWIDTHGACHDLVLRVVILQSLEYFLSTTDAFGKPLWLSNKFRISRT